MIARVEGGESHIIDCDPNDYKVFRSVLRSATLYRNTMPTDPSTEGRWVIRKGQPWPGRLLGDGTYPYTVSPDAEVRIARLPRPQGNIDHSELAREQPVVAAGMLKFKGGKISYISNESGHYCPDSETPGVAKMVFNFWGLPMVENVELDGRFSCH